VVAALEWQAEQDRKCKGCGQNLDETFGKANDDKWNAEPTGHCDACKAGHRAGMMLANRDELDPTVGVRYRYWRDVPSNGATTSGA
jgi:hypothetical protein